MTRLVFVPDLRYRDSTIADITSHNWASLLPSIAPPECRVFVFQHDTVLGEAFCAQDLLNKSFSLLENLYDLSLSAQVMMQREGPCFVH
jgi:hypothetical protein